MNDESIGDKAAHVRAAKPTGNHTCHWPGCQAQVPPAMWGCKPHWYKLPDDLRRRIWNAYKIGQENTGASPDYIAVAREVQEWIQKHGNKPKKRAPKKFNDVFPFE